MRLRTTTSHIRPASGQKAFTLVELTITVSIAAILVAVAVPSFSSFTAQQRVKAAAGDLYLVMAKARSEAVKRNTNVTVLPLSAGGWQSGWGIQDPVNGGYLDTHAAVSGVSITGSVGSIVYQGSGRIQGGQSVQFQLSPGTGGTANSRCLLLDAGGRPYLKATAC